MRGRTLVLQCAHVFQSVIHVNPLLSVSIETPHVATSWGMATRTNIGQIQQFHPDSESFAAYVERVEHFLMANDIPAEKEVPIFLSVVGGTTYQLLHNLLVPASPKDKSFKEIVDTLKVHFEPKPLVIAEKFHFHCRNQNSEESVAMYVAEL